MGTPYGLELAENCLYCKLRNDSFFCGLPKAPLEAFEKIKFTAAYPAGAVLFVEGQSPRGVYMLCRVFFLLNGPALEVVGWVGGFTALLAAVIAVQQNDIKRILAYSTLSQLGYMVMAVGLHAAPSAAAISIA